MFTLCLYQKPQLFTDNLGLRILMSLAPFLVAWFAVRIGGLPPAFAGYFMLAQPLCLGLAWFAPCRHTRWTPVSSGRRR